MRLAIVSRDFPPAPSGIGDHTDLLTQELASRGYEVTVICASPAEPRTNIDLRPVLTGLDARGLPALDAAVAETRPDALLWQFNPFQIGRKGVGPSAGRIARTLARRAPLVVVAHELWYDFGRNGLRGFVWAGAQRLETLAVVKAADRVVVTTEARRAELVRRFPERVDEISVIPTGATIEPDVAAQVNGTRASLGLPSGSFVLAHLGSAGDGREFGPAFDALRELRAEGIDARLLCVGRGAKADPPADLARAVVFTGVLPRGDVSRALAASDAYLFAEPAGPSLGRKTSLLAAFAHGLPVVAYAGHDRDPGLRDGENVVLVEPQAADIGAAVRRLFGDPAFRRRIGHGARRLYAERFSWTVIGSGFDAVLKGLGR